MIKIGILSDTHGLLRPEVLDSLQGCDYILHGGDINKQSILDELEKIAPVSVVRGNNDMELEGLLDGRHIHSFSDTSFDISLQTPSLRNGVFLPPVLS